MMLAGRGDKLRCVFDDVSWWGDKLRCVFDDVSWEGGQVKVRF